MTGIRLEVARKLARELLAETAAEFEKEDPAYALLAGRLEAELRILLDALDEQDGAK